MDDFSDPYHPRRSNIFLNPGFRQGAVGGIIMVTIHLLFLLILAGDIGNRGYVPASIIQVVVYIFLSRAAAEVQHRENVCRGDFDHLKGVAGAGIGAPMIISFIVWLFKIILAIVRDAFGVLIIVEPYLPCFIAVDVLLAIGIGAWAGNSIVRKYSAYAYNNQY
jgi:hypothetical protein